MARKKKIKEETSIKILKEISKRIDVDVINKRIIDGSNVDKFVDVFVTDNDTHKHAYVDYKDESKTSIEQFERNVYISTYRVSLNITQDHFDSLTSHNIHGTDFSEMIRNILLNEAGVTISRNVISEIKRIANTTFNNELTVIDRIKTWTYKLFKREYKKHVKISDSEDLIKVILKESELINKKSKWGHGNFVICGIHTLGILQGESNYEYKAIPIKNNQLYNGTLYPIGKIRDITFYVDPNMLWSDNSVYIGNKTMKPHPGIKVFISKDDSKTEIVTEGKESPKVVFDFKFLVIPIGDSTNLYRKFEYEDNTLY